MRTRSSPAPCSRSRRSSRCSRSQARSSRALLQLAIAVSMVYVAWLGWRGGRVMRAALAAAGDAEPAAHGETLPSVSVVVAARRRGPVIDRVVGDLVAQAYGRDGDAAARGGRRGRRLERWHRSARRAWRAASIPTGCASCRREPRIGPRTKGAALAFATPHLHGDDRGRRRCRCASRSGLGGRRRARAGGATPPAAALQVQRRASNRSHSWLTAAQDEEQLMDMASQCGRWATDGTAELRGNGMFVRRDRARCGRRLVAAGPDRGSRPVDAPGG